MKKIDEAKSILTLNRTVIDKLSFERFSEDVHKIDENGQITFDHQMRQIDKSTFRVVLGVDLIAKEKYEIRVQIAGIFSISEESVFGEKILANNTVAILFPYLRSQLTLLTSQPGFEPVILPVMNINALMNEK